LISYYYYIINNTRTAYVHLTHPDTPLKDVGPKLGYRKSKLVESFALSVSVPGVGIVTLPTDTIDISVPWLATSLPEKAWRPTPSGIDIEPIVTDLPVIPPAQSDIEPIVTDLPAIPPAQSDIEPIVTDLPAIPPAQSDI
jgi:hypothetical protein